MQTSMPMAMTTMLAMVRFSTMWSSLPSCWASASSVVFSGVII